MIVYVINDSFCGVHGVFRQKDDAIKKFEEIAERLQREADLAYLGRAKFHIWWENDCGEQKDLYLTEAELT